MRIELNHIEYISVLCSKHPLCNTCAWKPFPDQYCIKFCRMGRVFRTTRIAPSIFHL